MSRKLFLLLFALLAAMILPVGSTVLAQSSEPEVLTDDCHEWPWPDVEPNDTPAQAVPVEFGVGLDGHVNMDDPFDYYRFTAQAGEAIALTSDYGHYEPEDVPLLLDSSLNSIPLLEPYPLEYPKFFKALLPSTGTYYIGITRGDLASNSSYVTSYYYDFYRLLDVEPNDTPAQASPLQLGDFPTGDLSELDPIDYYTFAGVAGHAIAMIEPAWGNGNVFVTMLDASLNEIPLQPYSNWAVLPTNGTYYFKITGQYLQPNYTNDYSYHFVKLEGDEPNDTFETAIPVEALATVQGTWDYDCDVDMYRFEGRKGDVFPVSLPDRFYSWNPEYGLYDVNGNRLWRDLVLPADGTYYLKMYGWWHADDGEGDCYYAGDEYTVTIGYPMWVSVSQNGLPTNGGTPITPADIAMRANAPGKWWLVFDGSDVGITRNVDAIERLVDGSILLSLAAAQNVPGLGQVMPQDIIRFIPTSLGKTTAGTFEWYLDGSDVGLTTTGENIDAIHMSPYDYAAYPLMISVTGAGAAPRQSGGTLAFKDEDLINFVGTAYGTVSAGKWRMNLDGSTLTGMAAEDISASTYIDVWPDRNSRLLLVFNSAFNIEGIKGGPKDIVEPDPPQPDLNESIVIKNLTIKPIDAITVGVSLTP